MGTICELTPAQRDIVMALRQELRSHRQAIETARHAALRALVPGLPEDFFVPDHVYLVSLPLWLWLKTAEYSGTDHDGSYNYLGHVLNITEKEAFPLVVDVTRLQKRGVPPLRGDFWDALRAAQAALGQREGPAYWPHTEQEQNNGTESC
jgi:hypothetical protein